MLSKLTLDGLNSIEMLFEMDDRLPLIRILEHFIFQKIINLTDQGHLQCGERSERDLVGRYYLPDNHLKYDFEPFHRS